MRAMAFHVSSACPESLVECKGCGVEVKRRDESEHELKACPETTIACAYYSNGCSMSFKRRDENDHYLTHAALHAKMNARQARKMKLEIYDLRRSTLEAKAMLTAALRGGVAFPQGSKVDCRDHVGMWLKAEIKKRVQGASGSSRVFVHFSDWEDRWDEWILLDNATFRFAPAGFYTGTCEDMIKFHPGERVEVYLTRPLPRIWRPARVRKIHRQQVKVEFVSEGRRHEYWFHSKSLEIRKLSSVSPPPIPLISPVPPALFPPENKGTKRER